MLIIWGVVATYDTVAQQFLPQLSLPSIFELTYSRFPVFGWRLWFVIGLILVLLAALESAYRRKKAFEAKISELENKLNAQSKSNIQQVVGELLSIGLYTDMPINIARILYHDKDKLAVGFSNEVTTNLDKLYLTELNLRKIVKLEQRKVRIYGSDNVRDEGYWILTELGKDVILHLQENQQVLDKEGSLKQ